MRNLFYFIVSLAVLVGCTTKHSSVPANQAGSFHDTHLADSLGADERGMKTYMMVLLKTGPQDSVIIDKQKRAEIFQGHFSHMEKMQKEGTLVMAGPFATKNHLSYRGIFLLNADSPEQAYEIVKADPSISSKIFTVEILPFYGSAAIPLHLKYHQKISKQ